MGRETLTYKYCRCSRYPSKTRCGPAHKQATLRYRASSPPSPRFARHSLPSPIQISRPARTEPLTKPPTPPPTSSSRGRGAECGEDDATQEVMLPPSLPTYTRLLYPRIAKYFDSAPKATPSHLLTSGSSFPEARDGDAAHALHAFQDRGRFSSH
jgi:hypothetical protein